MEMAIQTDKQKFDFRNNISIIFLYENNDVYELLAP